MEGPRADSEEKQEPASDFDTALEDRLKALDPERPIREADIASIQEHVCFGRPITDVADSFRRRHPTLQSIRK